MTNKQNAHIRERVKVQVPLYVHVVGALGLLALLYIPSWILSSALQLPPTAGIGIGVQYAVKR